MTRGIAILSVLAITSAACGNTRDEGASSSEANSVRLDDLMRQPAFSVGDFRTFFPPDDGSKWTWSNIATAAFFDSSSLAILDATTPIVLVLSTAGVPFAAIDAVGPGPKDLRRPVGLQRISDGAAALFESPGRITLLNPDLEIQGRESTVGPDRDRIPVAILDDSLVLFRAPHWPTFAGRDPGPFTDSIHYFLLHRRMAESTRYAVLPNRDWWIQVYQGDGRRDVIGRSLPFGSSSSLAANGNTVAFTRGDKPEVTLLDRTGSVTSSARIELARKRVTASLWQAYVDSVLNAVPEGQLAAVRRLLTEPQHPEHVPVGARLTADNQGRFWLTFSEVPGHPETTFVVVLDPAGKVLAWSHLPTGIHMLAVYENLIAAKRHDERTGLDFLVLATHTLGLPR